MRREERSKTRIAGAGMCSGYRPAAPVLVAAVLELLVFFLICLYTMMTTTAAKMRNVITQITLSVAILRAMRLITFVERASVVSMAVRLSAQQKQREETVSEEGLAMAGTQHDMQCCCL